MRKGFLLLIFYHLTLFLQAQQVETDTIIALPDIRVKAFEQNHRLKDVPAPVLLVNRSEMERFAPVSLVQAVNSMPGVRMEERSPGSYRFNIRGSSLRSPFGVRNVKTYFNDIPITDPGGNTYLNQLGYYNFNSLEVIKGPGSSLYGAGTGGVLLIESTNGNEAAGGSLEYTTGSYRLQNIYGSITTGNNQQISKIGFQHQENRGYRDHSELKRDVYSWTGLFRLDEKRFLKTSFLYGNLFYETPGALTRAEYDANPRAARPGTGIFPGAEQARASIRQRSFLAGASYRQQLNKAWQNKSVLYGMFTELRNPAIRNYGKNSEPHFGGRTIFRHTKAFHSSQLDLDLGGEFQEGFSTVEIYKNRSGQPDSLQTHDEINNRQCFVFGQASFESGSWTFTAGASLNWLRVKFQRFTPATNGAQTRKFSNQVAPRLAIMKKFGGLNLYGSLSRGFSPPTTTELLPTGSAINLGLNAEEGLNYDAGIKAHFFHKLFVDLNAFIFSLDQTIVQRRDAGGGEYFVNAGSTRQHGIETYLNLPLFASSSHVEHSLAWLSHTWHEFTYKSFKQLTNDYSGNALPGTGHHTISTGMDLLLKKGWLGSINYYFSDRIPLDDANSAYADPYHLVGIRIGYQKWIRGSFRIKLTAGAENLLDQHYSLGNDINGFGGRFYNAAPGRNYFVSLLLQVAKKKTVS